MVHARRPAPQPVASNGPTDVPPSLGAEPEPAREPSDPTPFMSAAAQVGQELTQALALPPGSVEIRADPAATAEVGARGRMDDGAVLVDPSAVDPRSPDGRELLAHEFAHVAQQGLAPAPVADPGKVAEGEAAEFAARFASGRAPAGVRAGLPQGHVAAEGDGGSCWWDELCDDVDDWFSDDAPAVDEAVPWDPGFAPDDGGELALNERRPLDVGVGAPPPGVDVTYAVTDAGSGAIAPTGANADGAFDLHAVGVDTGVTLEVTLRATHPTGDEEVHRAVVGPYDVAEPGIELQTSADSVIPGDAVEVTARFDAVLDPREAPLVPQPVVTGPALALAAAAWDGDALGYTLDAREPGESTFAVTAVAAGSAPRDAVDLAVEVPGCEPPDAEPFVPEFTAPGAASLEVGDDASFDVSLVNAYELPPGAELSWEYGGAQPIGPVDEPGGALGGRIADDAGESAAVQVWADGVPAGPVSVRASLVVDGGVGARTEGARVYDVILGTRYPTEVGVVDVAAPAPALDAALVPGPLGGSGPTDLLPGDEWWVHVAAPGVVDPEEALDTRVTLDVDAEVLGAIDGEPMAREAPFELVEQAWDGEELWVRVRAHHAGTGTLAVSVGARGGPVAAGTWALASRADAATHDSRLEIAQLVHGSLVAAHEKRLADCVVRYDEASRRVNDALKAAEQAQIEESERFAVLVGGAFTLGTGIAGGLVGGALASSTLALREGLANDAVGVLTDATHDAAGSLLEGEVKAATGPRPFSLGADSPTTFAAGLHAAVAGEVSRMGLTFARWQEEAHDAGPDARFAVDPVNHVVAITRLAGHAPDEIEVPTADAYEQLLWDTWIRERGFDVIAGVPGLLGGSEAQVVERIDEDLLAHLTALAGALARAGVDASWLPVALEAGRRGAEARAAALGTRTGA